MLSYKKNQKLYVSKKTSLRHRLRFIIDTNNQRENEYRNSGKAQFFEEINSILNNLHESDKSQRQRQRHREERQYDALLYDLSVVSNPCENRGNILSLKNRSTSSPSLPFVSLI